MTRDDARTDHQATAREDRILTRGFRLNVILGLLALTLFIVALFSGATGDDRPDEWGEIAIVAVTVWNLAAIANVTAMYWYTTWRRRERGQPPWFPQDMRVIWVHTQVTVLSLVLCYIMIFRERGSPDWLLALTILNLANGVAAFVHHTREVRRLLKNAPRL